MQSAGSIDGYSRSANRLVWSIRGTWQGEIECAWQISQRVGLLAKPTCPILVPLKSTEDWLGWKVQGLDESMALV